MNPPVTLDPNLSPSTNAAKGPDQSVIALWPNQPSTARLLTIDPRILPLLGSLVAGRRLNVVLCGQDYHYSPSAVLILADHYQRRPITSVASDLVSLAEPVAESAEQLEALELDIQRYLQSTRAAATGVNPKIAE